LKRLRQYFSAILGGAVLIAITVIVYFPFYKNLAIAESPVVSTATIVRLNSFNTGSSGRSGFYYTIAFAGQEVPHYTSQHHEIGAVLPVVYCANQPRWYIQAKERPTWGSALFRVMDPFNLVLLPLLLVLVISILLKGILKKIRSNRKLVR
jgi:hypothetical protein